jgi:probable rRNA maturation factor
MSYTVDVQSTSRYPTPLLRAVAAAAHAAMTHQRVAEGAALTILLTDDDYIRQLNSQYRGEDHATDVLSFPAGEAMPGAEGLAEYLGDIAIAVPFAQRQATARGHDATAEMQLLAVHGVLHLLGYDHLDEDDKAAMWQAQADILRTLGLEGIQPTEEGYDDP